VIARQRDTVVLNRLAAVVFEAALNAPEAIHVKIVTVDRDQYIVTAKKGFKFVSYGEAIRIWVDEIGESRSIVRIVSKERDSFQTIDWGQNGRNIDAFLSALEGALATRESQAGRE
jgi:hypothetical protein